MSLPTAAPNVQTAAAEFLQPIPTAVLVAAASGGIDLNRLARQTLAGRGLNQAGEWVGFAAAAALVSQPKPARAPAPTCLIDTRRFMFSHGRMPRGQGTWLFELHTGQLACQFNGTYGAAAAYARKYGREHGHSVLFVCS